MTALGGNPIDDVVAIQKIVAAIKSAWEEGCPIAGGTSADQEQMAQISLRRWNSFTRRHRKSGEEQKGEDLAKGLRDAYEADRALVGPLMEDYRYLASVIAAVLLAEE